MLLSSLTFVQIAFINDCPLRHVLLTFISMFLSRAALLARGLAKTRVLCEVGGRVTEGGGGGGGGGAAGEGVATGATLG